MTPAEKREVRREKGEGKTFSLHPSPFPLHTSSCPHPTAYVRPDGTAVCLACAATLAPGAEAWEAQQITYCAPGLHQWGPRHADDTPRQCLRCPAVERREGGG